MFIATEFWKIKYNVQHRNTDDRHRQMRSPRKNENSAICKICMFNLLKCDSFSEKKHTNPFVNLTVFIGFMAVVHFHFDCLRCNKIICQYFMNKMNNECQWNFPKNVSMNCVAKRYRGSDFNETFDRNTGSNEIHHWITVSRLRSFYLWSVWQCASKIHDCITLSQCQ